MKRRFGKEMALLLLPALLLCSAGWWQASREHEGKAGFPSLFDSGPIRIEFSSFEEREMNAFDVARGYEWSGRVDLQIRGGTGLPASLHLEDYSLEGVELENAVLEYRRGSVWKKSSARGAIYKEGENSEQWDIAPQTLFIDLKSIPIDAKEVRVRGRFKTTRNFEGRIPAGSKLPKNLVVSANRKALTIVSKPFEVIVKAAGEAMPHPVVSRQPYLQFVKAKWVYDTNTSAPNFDMLTVRFRELSGRDNFASSSLRLTSLEIWDATGKRVNLYMHGAVDPFSPGISLCNMLDRQSYYPNLPKDEAIFQILDYAEPRHGWKSVKQPVDVKFTISDGKSWPLTVRTRLIRSGYRSFENLALGE